MPYPLNSDFFVLPNVPILSPDLMGHHIGAIFMSCCLRLGVMILRLCLVLPDGLDDL